MTRIYLDHAATAPLCAPAAQAMAQGFGLWANPSSPHAEGRAARRALEDARARLKSVLGWQGEVIFTSGASEALALAITASARPLSAVSAVEHDSVLRHAGEGVPCSPVDAEGLVDAEGAQSSGLVCVQQVNSETGVIQPMAEIAAAIRSGGGWLLADCAQGAGKLPLPDADMAVISAHKFGGPIGVGALLLRDYAMLKPGGGQERGYRAGTENLPGVLGMLAALEADAGWLERARQLRVRLDEAIVQAGGEIIAATAPRLATIASYRMPGTSANAQLIRFDGAGIAVSAGSACSSGSLKPSHVLTAMGAAGIGETIRVSIGRETTEADIDRFLAVWKGMATV